MIKNNANINAKNNSGKTILDETIEEIYAQSEKQAQARFEIIKILAESGASITEKNINHYSNGPKTKALLREYKDKQKK